MQHCTVARVVVWQPLIGKHHAQRNQNVGSMEGQHLNTDSNPKDHGAKVVHNLCKARGGTCEKEEVHTNNHALCMPEIIKAAAWSKKCL